MANTSTQQQYETVQDVLAARGAKLESRNWEPLIDQISREYSLAYDHIKPRWDIWSARLKLYNNQKRDKEAVGDPLMFTIMQSLLASLYIDRLSSVFEARSGGDEERCDQLIPMAEFDYDEMDKDILDYEWDWDTLFFGSGYLLMTEFSSEHQVPLPEVLDPMVTLIDPNCKSTQGTGKTARGAAQFLGWEATITSRQLKRAGVYFNINGLKTDSASEQRSRIDANHDARNEASGLDAVRNKRYTLIGDNRLHRVLNWFTWYRGRLCLVTLAENRTKVIRFEQLPKMRETIPVVQRTLFPIAHEKQGVSVPDLVEDKQRGRSVVQNAALKFVKLGILPRFVFNSTKIKNEGDLDAEFNKHISVDGDPNNAIVPVPMPALKQEVQYILDVLDTSAQRATATPDQQQGIPTSKRRTLGELEMVSANVDTRYSLAARIFGWSERRFWQEWYLLYKEYFADKIDEKVIRIAGAGGNTWKKLTRENIIADVDPDVRVEAKSVADAERMQKLQVFRAYVGDIIQDPHANIRYAMKELGKLSGLRRDKVDMLLPPTADELQAETENDALSENRVMYVLPSDDDLVHLIAHESASDTPAKYAHINAHKKALLLKRQHPEMFQAATPTPRSGINPTDLSGLPSAGKDGTALPSKMGAAQEKPAITTNDATQ